MKKFVLLVLALAMVLSAYTVAFAAAKKIGISMPTQSLERWNRDGEYLKAQFDSAGYETQLTYSDNKNDQQVNDIDNMISWGAELLIIAAIDGDGLNTVMDRAAEAGIPVIAYDRLIGNDAVTYYISFDNYTVGVLQGKFIEAAFDLKNANGKVFNIEFTAGDPADNNAGYFFRGGFDILKPYIDSGVLKVISGQTEFQQVATAQWNTDTALARAQNILASYYADGTVLHAWLCNNDSTAAGVTQALESDYAGSNAVVVTGQDGDIANLANIVDGKQTMTVYKNVANEAVVTLEVAKALLNGEVKGEELAKSFSVECAYDTTSYFTSPGHYTPSFLLVPTVVTKDNLDYLVGTGLYVMGEDGYLKAK